MTQDHDRAKVRRQHSNRPTSGQAIFFPDCRWLWHSPGFSVSGPDYHRSLGNPAARATPEAHAYPVGLARLLVGGEQSPPSAGRALTGAAGHPLGVDESLLAADGQLPGADESLPPAVGPFRGADEPLPGLNDPFTGAGHSLASGNRLSFGLGTPPGGVDPALAGAPAPLAGASPGDSSPCAAELSCPACRCMRQN